jgi:hypothetical protein
MKKKKLVKQALKNPELFTEAELVYFRKWLQIKQELKNGTRRLEIHETSTS